MSKYAERIREWCAENGVEVPAGFGRRAPSHLAVVRHDRPAHQLVATTWFKTADVLYYLDLQIATGADDDDFQILDFKNNSQLRRDGARLRSVGTL